MKNSKLFLGAGILVMTSCAGTAPESDQSGDTAQVVVDSVAAGAAFQQFVTYVNGLETVIENVDSALVKYDELKIDFSQNEKDTSFFVMKNFMMSFEITDEEIGMLTEERQKEIEKEYSQHGFEIWYFEGYPGAIPDVKFLERHFKKDISVELDDYLDVLKNTQVQVTSDGGIIIEWSELVDLLLTCEEFLTESKESRYASYVLDDYMQYLNFLMWGLDNTPVVNNWNQDAAWGMDEMVSEQYQKLIKDTKHKTGKIIADHLTWLESKNFQFDYEDVKYLSRDEVKMYLGIE